MYPLTGDKPFPQNQWYMAAWASELPEGGILARTILGTPLVLFRDGDGKAAVLDDRCPHRRFPLSKGWLTDGAIVCGYHGFRFDGTGTCVHVPSQTRPVASQKTRAYAVHEAWNWIWVWMGDAVDADPALLPDDRLVHADEPDWHFEVGGRARLAARYMLLHDNILDLTHLSYLHRNSVGSPGISRAKVRTTELPQGLTIDREVMGDTMEGTLLGAALNIEGPVDRIMPQEFRAPCLHISGPLFRSSADGGIDPGREFGSFRVVHAIVPETETTTHYFWGFTRNFAPADAAMSDALRSNISAALAEDIEASEAIEAMLQIEGGPDEIHCPADAAGAKGRRIIQQLIDAEGLPSVSKADCNG